MDREKYINDKSYREGYLDGRREGAHAFEKAVKPYVEKIQKDIADLEEECLELEKDKGDE